jgi:DNA processing protein
MTLFDAPLPTDLGNTGLRSVSGLRRLCMLRGIGPRKAELLAGRFSTWQELLDAPLDALASLVGRLAADFHHSMVECGEPTDLPPDVVAVGRFDPEWPDWLSGLSSAPVVVFYRGSLPFGDRIAVVGTRDPTEFGASVVDRIVAEAADRNIGVVSGLALGIDGLAHEAALRFGAPTWAILGGGVDQHLKRRWPCVRARTRRCSRCARVGVSEPATGRGSGRCCDCTVRNPVWHVTHRSICS